LRNQNKIFFKKNKNYFRKKKTACILFGRQKFSRVNNKLDLSLCRPFPRQSLRLFSKQIRACVAHVFHKHPPRVRFFHSIIPGHLFFCCINITFVFFTAPTFIFFTASSPGTTAIATRYCQNTSVPAVILKWVRPATRLSANRTTILPNRRLPLPLPTFFWLTTAAPFEIYKK
jgi:hypothetical protein